MPAQSRHLRSPRDIRRSRGNRKYFSPGRRPLSNCLPNYQLALSTVRLSQRVSLSPAQARTTTQKPVVSPRRRALTVRLSQQVSLSLTQVRTTQKLVVLAQSLPMFLRGWSCTKPEPSYQQHSQSEPPCPQPSSWQWALSEVLSI